MNTDQTLWICQIKATQLPAHTSLSFQSFGCLSSLNDFLFLQLTATKNNILSPCLDMELRIRNPNHGTPASFLAG